MVHASDCALNNAPASAPGVCTCGSSTRFRHWGYDIHEDVSAFLLDCRETLIAKSVAAAFTGHFRAGGRGGVYIRRAVNEGFEPEEMSAFLREWRACVQRDPDESRKRGIPDCLLSEDLSPLTPEVRASIAAEPDMAEIQAVMQGWIEYWRILAKAPTLEIAA